MVPLSFKVNLVNDGVSGLVSVTDLTIEIDSVVDTERESVENLDTGETCYILVNHYNCQNINSCTNCKISSRPSENKRRREVERSREKSLLQPYWSHLSLEYVKIQTFSIYFLGRRYGIL